MQSRGILVVGPSLFPGQLASITPYEGAASLTQHIANVNNECILDWLHRIPAFGQSMIYFESAYWEPISKSMCFDISLTVILQQERQSSKVRMGSYATRLLHLLCCRRRIAM